MSYFLIMLGGIAAAIVSVLLVVLLGALTYRILKQSKQQTGKRRKGSGEEQPDLLKRMAGTILPWWRYLVALVAAVVLLWLVIPLVLPDVASWYASPDRPEGFLWGIILVLIVAVVAFTAKTPLGKLTGYAAVLIFITATVMELSKTPEVREAMRDDHQTERTAGPTKPQEQTLFAPVGAYASSKPIPEGFCLRYTTRKPEQDRIEAINVSGDQGHDVEAYEIAEKSEGFLFRSKVSEPVRVHYYVAPLGSKWCKKDRYGRVYRLGT